MNFIILLLLSTFCFCAEWFTSLRNNDEKRYYSLNQCIASSIYIKVNDTHVNVTRYDDKDCKIYNTSYLVKAKFTSNLQYYIDESYYYIQIYNEKDCNDEDFSIPIVGYYLFMNEHCNTEVGYSQPVQEVYLDHSEDRIFTCYDALGVNSSICKYGVNYPGEFCYGWYEGQCYYTGQISKKYYINRRRFETDDVDPLALLVVFIFVLLII